MRAAGFFARSVAVLLCLSVLPLATQAQGSARGNQARSTAERGGTERVAHVRGAVEDSGGAPIPEVHVSIFGTVYQAVTDARGAFRFPDVRPGSYFVRARRLGYEPLVFRIDVQPSDTMLLGLQMNSSATSLSTVVVTEQAPATTLRLVGFEDRRRFSGASQTQFVTRADIEKRNPAMLSQMLNRMGTRVKECQNAVIYLDGMLLSTAPRDEPRPTIMMGAKNDSLAKIGAPLPRENPLNNFPPVGIEGMEVYAGPSEIPPQYNPSGRGAECVILLWTR